VSGNTITWSWGGGGGSGLPIANYELCVDGNCSNVGSSPGSSSPGFACGQTHTATAYVVDSMGQHSSNNPSNSQTTAACPIVTVSWGARADSSICKGDPSCTYLVISWSNFGSGSHTISPTSNGAYWGYPNQVRAGSSGTLGSTYAAGFCRESTVVMATVDGVPSNQINTEDHGC
jgi:hypothetical protein